MPARLAVGFGWETPGRNLCTDAVVCGFTPRPETGQTWFPRLCRTNSANGSRAAAELGNRLGSAASGEDRHRSTLRQAGADCHIQVTGWDECHSLSTWTLRMVLLLWPDRRGSVDGVMSGGGRDGVVGVGVAAPVTDAELGHHVVVLVRKVVAVDHVSAAIDVELH